MPPDNDKIDEIHKVIYAMKPMLEDVRDSQRGMDTRMRAVEIVGAEHKVKIDRIQSDMDGLGRKVRSIQPLSIAEKRGEPRGGWWAGMMDFFEALPFYWKFILPWASAIIATVVAAWRHRP